MRAHADPPLLRSPSHHHHHQTDPPTLSPASVPVSHHAGGAPGRHDLCWPAHRVWIRRRRRGGCRQSAYACGTDASSCAAARRAGQEGNDDDQCGARHEKRRPRDRSSTTTHPPTRSGAARQPADPLPAPRAVRNCSARACCSLKYVSDDVLPRKLAVMHAVHKVNPEWGFLRVQGYLFSKNAQKNRGGSHNCIVIFLVCHLFSL